MKKHSQTISIAAANYNNSAFLEDFFESILASTVLPNKCVVCDDGSTDGSQAIIEGYAAKHDWIEYIAFEENRGVAHATNAAIARVQSAYVLRVDTDDMVLPMRIAEQERFVQEHPEVDVLGGNCVYFDSGTGEGMHTSRFPADKASIRALMEDGENGVLNGTTLVKRTCFDSYQYDQEMVWAEDYDLFARMLHGGCVFAGQEEPYTRVRIHRSSVTSNLEIDTLSKANDLCKKLFGNSKSQSELNHYYYHLLHYRRYMMSSGGLKRYYHLLLAIVHRPSKLIDRLIRR